MAQERQRNSYNRHQSYGHANIDKNMNKKIGKNDKNFIISIKNLNLEKMI